MKPRDPRHKVLVKARMRAGSRWHDTCILNISSRGMLLQAGIPPKQGSCLEIRRGAVVIVARVVWAKSHRFGVKCQDVLSLAAIVGDPSAAEPIAAPGVADRRRIERAQLPARERSRLLGRMIEYGFGAALALGVAGFAAQQVYSILARPAGIVTAALSGAEAAR